jgi:hypothetical protein
MTEQVDTDNSMCEWDCTARPVNLTMQHAWELWRYHWEHPVRECRVVVAIIVKLTQAGQLPVSATRTPHPFNQRDIGPVTPPHSREGLEHILAALKRWAVEDREIQAILEGMQ